MKTTLILLALALFATAPLFAFQEDAETKEDPSLKAVQKVADDFQKQMQAFSIKYGEAATDEERQKILEGGYPDPKSFFPQMFEVAKKHPNSKGGLKALSWIINNSQDGEDSAKAIGRVARDYMSDAGLGDVCLGLIYHGTISAGMFLDICIRQNKHKPVLALACFASAKWKSQAAKNAATLQGQNEEMKGWLRGSLDKETLTFLKTADGNQLIKESTELLQRVEKEFAEVPFMGDRLLGEVAKGALFELTRLQIGQQVPDIKAEDIDGVEFALSDYLGKVVVLDFWGDW